MQQGINQSREAKSSNNFQINSIGIFEINAVSYLILEPHYQTYTHYETLDLLAIKPCKLTKVHQ